MLRTSKGFEKKEKEHWFHFTALVKNFPQNINIALTIYTVFNVNKKQWSTISRRLRHAREFLYLENKNILRTFLDLKLKKLRTSEGFLQFWCSYKKNKRVYYIKVTWRLIINIKTIHDKVSQNIWHSQTLLVKLHLIRVAQTPNGKFWEL